MMFSHSSLFQYLQNLKSQKEKQCNFSHMWETHLSKSPGWEVQKDVSKNPVKGTHMGSAAFPSFMNLLGINGAQEQA